VAADKKRVLVIDDDEMIRDLTQVMLESEGYQVSVASDGSTGLVMINADPPDLVLLDLTMPRLDGWGVIEGLKSHHAPPPLIVMSGLGVEEPPRLRAVSEYVFGYLAKPFDVEKLAKTCRRVLEAAASAPDAGKDYSDRRREPRRTLVVPAALLSQEGTPAAVGQILNLSPGGAQLDLGAALRPGTELTLAFDIPGGHGPFRVTGRIQWKREGKVGLMFTQMSGDDKKRLEELLGA
jgi:two-component system chemotaxis response regulator CheY